MAIERSSGPASAIQRAARRSGNWNLAAISAGPAPRNRCRPTTSWRMAPQPRPAHPFQQEQGLAHATQWRRSSVARAAGTRDLQLGGDLLVAPGLRRGASRSPPSGRRGTSSRPAGAAHIARPARAGRSPERPTPRARECAPSPRVDGCDIPPRRSPRDRIDRIRRWSRIAANQARKPARSLPRNSSNRTEATRWHSRTRSDTSCSRSRSHGIRLRACVRSHDRHEAIKSSSANRLPCRTCASSCSCTRDADDVMRSFPVSTGSSVLGGAPPYGRTPCTLRWRRDADAVRDARPPGYPRHRAETPQAARRIPMFAQGPVKSFDCRGWAA